MGPFWSTEKLAVEVDAATTASTFALGPNITVPNGEVWRVLSASLAGVVTGPGHLQMSMWLGNLPNQPAAGFNIRHIVAQWDGGNNDLVTSATWMAAIWRPSVEFFLPSDATIGTHILANSTGLTATYELNVMFHRLLA
jgi:hypothetical protein